jgi:membrane protease YdiL (CAAX protease family)
MYLSNASDGLNAWWRYLLTLAITILAFVAGHGPLFLVVSRHLNESNLTPEQSELFMQNGNFAEIGINANLSLFVMTLPFAIALMALLFSVHFIHKRSVLALITSRVHLDLERVLWGCVSWFVFAGIIAAIVLPKEYVQYQFDFAAFLPMALIAISFVPLQVAAEEILFRGYLLQALARVIKSPLVLLALVTLLFVLPHLGNPEFAHGLTNVLPFYLILGAMFGALAILDDGLELPIGVHLGNNLFAAILLSTHDGALSTPAIFQTGVQQLIAALPWLIIAILATFLALHLKFKFHWSKLIKLH